MPNRPLRRIKPRLVHENPWWKVWYDDVEFPGGSTGRHLRLTPTSEKPGAVAFVTHTADGLTRVALVHQWRYAQNTAVWEFPRGFADNADASSHATAAREAAEETGSTVLSVRELGSVCPDSSIIELRVGVFHVEVELHPAVEEHKDCKQHREGEAAAIAAVSEIDDLRWVTFPELLELVAAGEISDAFTLSALGLLLSQPRATHPRLSAAGADQPMLDSPAIALKP